MQDQLFSSLCFPMGIHYKNRPHLLNRKSLHCCFSVPATRKAHRVVDLFLPSTSQDKPQDIVSYTNYAQDNRDFRTAHHYRLTLVFVVADSSGIIFRRSL